MSKNSTVCAGIDTGKHKLDVAIDGGAEGVQVDNNSQGHRTCWPGCGSARSSVVGHRPGPVFSLKLPLTLAGRVWPGAL
jgi:hypothetical protein